MKKEMGCKSPEHSPSCPCVSCRKPRTFCLDCKVLTIQHIIPRCIGRKVLGMSEKEIDSYQQEESKACHRMNDSLVSNVFERMMRLKRQGVIFEVKDVLLMRENGEFKK